MAEQKNAAVENVVERIRALNERIVSQSKERGEEAVATYERLLENLADAQEEAGNRSADWVREFANAQAAFTRRLASSFPTLLQTIGAQGRSLADRAAEQVRKVPGASQAEGLVRGAVSREGDLPIADYDDLTAEQIGAQLAGLSTGDLAKVAAYEARTKNRKTVHDAIAKAGA